MDSTIKFIQYNVHEYLCLINVAFNGRQELFTGVVAVVVVCYVSERERI